MEYSTSRERIVKALKHEEPDRIPIDFGGSTVTLIHEHAHKALANYLKISNPGNDFQSIVTQAVYVDKRIKERFKSDVEIITPGKLDKWNLEIDANTGKWKDEWGNIYKKPEGVMYYEWDYNPLSKIDNIEELKKYEIPDPCDQGRYRDLKVKIEKIYKNTDRALFFQHAFGILEQYLTLRGLENALIDLVANQKFTEYLVDKLTEWLQTYYETALKLIGKYIQVVKMNDDLGFKDGPLMSPEIYRKIFKPRHKKIVEIIKKYTDAKIFIHSDGSIYDFLPDFVEIGIDIINPVEITAKNMDGEILKKEFGKDFSLGGG
ncbi:MAG: hypothetical protein HQ569_07675 [Actinobacteria bacterium]|nr:hypothetical protein [Actinomycetota bacterium]